MVHFGGLLSNPYIKFSFNNAGFCAFQNSLYQLSDEKLKQQSELISHDFTSWLSYHFMLHEHHLFFLESIDDNTKQRLSFDTSFAIENRLPICLNNKNKINEDWQKIIWPNTKSDLIYYKACGTLQINMDYHLK